MAAENFAYYREFLIVLAAAGLVVPLFLRLGINATLSFLIVGLLLSPDVLGRLVKVIPAFAAISLADSANVASLAELGVVFLLFLIGLELSFERLMTMRRLVFGLGSLQVCITLAAISAVLYLLGFGLELSLILGAAFSLSSTAIVVQLLSDTKRLGSQTGRTSFAILLFQDLAVIPLLLLVAILARDTGGPVLIGIAAALAQAGLAIAAIVVIGRYALRPLLRMVAGANSPDLFMAATLLIAVGTGVAANLAGLSMALGGFIAGLMLAETEYRRAIEAMIEPFKGLLLGAFFLLVGPASISAVWPAIPWPAPPPPWLSWPSRASLSSPWRGVSASAAPRPSKPPCCSAPAANSPSSSSGPPPRWECFRPKPAATPCSSSP
jgi:CPA2 family monovalent cation:H+ antiporter-2